VTAEQPAPGVVRFLWSQATAADAYAVARATLAEVRSSRYGQCVVTTQDETRYEDDGPPAPGEGFAYMIRGINATCGVGTLGAGPGGFERINADPLACW
jgi:hypothetical protein